MDRAHVDGLGKRGERRQKFSLVDKEYSSTNLKTSWEKVRSNKRAAGVDRQSIEAYEKEAKEAEVQIIRDGQMHTLLILDCSQ